MSHQLEAIEELLIAMRGEIGELRQQQQGGAGDYRGPFNDLTTSFRALVSQQEKTSSYFEALSVANFHRAIRDGTRDVVAGFLEHLGTLQKATQIAQWVSVLMVSVTLVAGAGYVIEINRGTNLKEISAKKCEEAKGQVLSESDGNKSCLLRISK